MEKRKVNIKRLTAVLLSAAVLIIGGIAVSAAYINLNTVKRVVSTQGTAGTPFSSNYLLLVPNNTDVYAVKNIYFPSGAESTEFEINVCNYVQNDPTKVNEKEISYTFILTQQNSDGTVNTTDVSGLSVKNTGGTTFSFSSGVCTISGDTLAGNAKSVNTYTVTVPKEMVGKIELKAEAVPDSGSLSAVNGNKLGRVFSFSEYIISANSWTGSFYETTSDNYDGFNYIIKGQGKGTLTITWDNNQLEINKVFLVTNSLTDKVTVNGSKSTLTMDVDSTVGNNRYDIQFYKTENGSYSDMEIINGYVTVTFTEAAV